uniref:non-specific serine/threonine protein kinase n=1 Tax=Gongylonema pulchrum TaxID=637853 RepID=A0A183EAT2_9BILA
LLVTLDGTLKISDFGVAEMLDMFQADDWCTIVQGTPKFQPPEIVSGTSEHYRGRKVDIWACGVTLYNLVSGEYPFEGDVIMRLFDNIANQPLRMPRGVQLSKPLEYLLGAMLKKDPEKRMNMHDIRRCEWYTQKIEADESRRVPVSVCNNMPAHRPLSVYVQLEQLYGIALDGDSCRDGSADNSGPVIAMDVEPSLPPEYRHLSEPLNETKRNRSMLDGCFILEAGSKRLYSSDKAQQSSIECAQNVSTGTECMDKAVSVRLSQICAVRIISD